MVLIRILENIFLVNLKAVDNVCRHLEDCCKNVQPDSGKMYPSIIFRWKNQRGLCLPTLLGCFLLPIYKKHGCELWIRNTVWTVLCCQHVFFTNRIRILHGTFEWKSIQFSKLHSSAFIFLQNYLISFTSCLNTNCFLGSDSWNTWHLLTVLFWLAYLKHCLNDLWLVCMLN